ncbi:hypothetical protein [Nocardioides zhouii]|uniref:Uncharacterized protein n=1 Tax=Nocardioides zhouii TaxID=1168729 RepID=A0A4Q2T120_9ACTN|nr:hypothetical protein [Nocardioides zhouii]RYC10614.1 hypothetical protein EUA94_12545 [Nocardioides zhouii]
MTSRMRSRLFALAVLATLTAPLAAHAETVTVRDTVGDVEAFYLNEDQDTLPAPHYAASDITRTVTAYGMERLKVTVHLRDLRHASALRTDVLIRTPDGRYFGSVVRGLRKVRTVFGHPRRGEVECEGFTGTYEGGKDRVTVVVPVACIDSPRWVRVGVTTTGIELEDTDTEDFPFHVDDGGRDGDGGQWARLGQRIRRG